MTLLNQLEEKHQSLCERFPDDDPATFGTTTAIQFCVAALSKVLETNQAIQAGCRVISPKECRIFLTSSAKNDVEFSCQGGARSVGGLYTANGPVPENAWLIDCPPSYVYAPSGNDKINHGEPAKAIEDLLLWFRPTTN